MYSLFILQLPNVLAINKCGYGNGHWHEQGRIRSAIRAVFNGDYLESRLMIFAGTYLL